MNYIEVYFKTQQSIAEILLAEMGDLPYDTFEEVEDGLKAYVEEKLFDEASVKQLVEQYESLGEITYSTKSIPKVNWNEEWEKNFHPITVADQILVRADFHQVEKKYPYEIIIVPKMSFGTGHHDTTSQMLQFQLEVDQQGKKVLDAGTGTGILAIMADKRGATSILANDIDQWCIDNSQDNFSLNYCQAVDLKLGAIQVFEGEEVDVLLANINKNVLLSEIPSYSKLVKKEGVLLLSGFYEPDIEDIEKTLNQNGFQKLKHSVQNKWAAMLCVKSS